MSNIERLEVLGVDPRWDDVARRARSACGAFGALNIHLVGLLNTVPDEERVALREGVTK